MPIPLGIFIILLRKNHYFCTLSITINSLPLWKAVPQPRLLYMDILWFVIGLLLILVGANALTDGASAIASRLGVSDLIIGLTIVAFGTSAPELIVALMSALMGSPTLAVGNVVGSNIMNVLVIIGVTAMVRPIVVERSVMTTEIPIMIASSVVVLILGNSGWLDGDGENVITRVDGIFLLLALGLFMRHTIISAKDTGAKDAGVASMSTIAHEGEGAVASTKPMAVWKAVAWIVVGLGALVWGGDRFVEGASGIARQLGLSEAIIGLTIVAGGTSLPELATSVVAAIKGKPGLAVGNVIGSNIMNVFLILGLTATVAPLPFGGINNVDLLTLVGASVLFWLVGWLYKERTITRVEGALLTAVYVAYVVYLISQV